MTCIRVSCLLLLLSLCVAAVHFRTASCSPSAISTTSLEAAAAAAAAAAAPSPPRRVPRFRPPAPRHHVLRSTIRADLLSKCQEKWRNATLDHFTFGKHEKDVPDTFPQRYFLCDTYWQPDVQGNAGPIFFYFGNEANVELYLNNTGLMWETAPDVGALLVFAEHRYYGESKPFDPKLLPTHMNYLTAEQAMADYAGLIEELKEGLPGAKDSAVVGFGGSYGGMLGSWFRMKYPHLLDGVIAASAPIWSFMGEAPQVDASYFAKGTTYDCSEAGGSAASCVPNVKAGWKALQELGETKEGRALIHSSMSLCPAAKLEQASDVVELRDWLAAAWDYMAMGNFPYPSGYMLNGMGELPAFPVRKACEHLKVQGLQDEQLLTGLAAAAGVFYNYSGALSCLDFRQGANPESSEDSNFWDYQYCTEMLMPFTKTGASDMFWPEPFDADAVAEGCLKAWGVRPRPLWATQEWGGRRIEAHSNIVFSNGLLDPWHGGGVVREVSDTIVALIIPEGAHHLDLMFSHPDDPQSVTEVRQEERRWIQRWIQQARDQAQRAKALGGAREEPAAAIGSGAGVGSRAARLWGEGDARGRGVVGGLLSMWGRVQRAVYSLVAGA